MAQQLHTPMTKTVRVLIVEDDMTVCAIAKAICNTLGCTVYTAANGLEGLELWENHAIDIVFMDLQMPVMGGFETAYEIRQREAEQGLMPVPIVAVTATENPVNYLACLQMGMEECLTKPYTLSMIEKAIFKYVWHYEDVAALPPEEEMTEMKSGAI